MLQLCVSDVYVVATELDLTASSLPKLTFDCVLRVSLYEFLRSGAMHLPGDQVHPSAVPFLRPALHDPGRGVPRVLASYFRPWAEVR